MKTNSTIRRTRGVRLAVPSLAAMLWLVQPLAAAAANEREVVVRPEYERALERIYLSVPDEFDTRAGAGHVDPEADLEFIRQAYAELVAALPRYTKVDLAVSRRQRERVVPAFGGVEAAARPRDVSVHVLDARNAQVDMWAQDLGERILVGGQPRFLVPMAIDRTAGAVGELASARRKVARQVFGSALVEADFVFEGGNLAFDRTARGLRVFVGYNDVWLTMQEYARRGRPLDEEDVARLVSQNFGGAEVIVVGREPQSSRLFHIDQTFILLGPGVAVVNRLVGAPSREQRQLEETTRQLEALGYRTIAIDHTAEQVERFQVSTNAVPFVNRETGEKTIIFPVFPGEVTPGAGASLGVHDLQGKGLAAYRAYEAAGYRPIPVRDVAHLVGGNTHCIANVLN